MYNLPAEIMYCFPTEEEAAVFRTLRPDADVRIIGVGMAEATAVAATFIAAFGPKRLVLCGIAGACDDSVSLGQVVEVAEDVVAGLPDAYTECYKSRTTAHLPQVKSLTVSHSGDSLRYLTSKPSSPYIEQMEGAGVAAACKALDVEFYHIRAISNRVGDDRSKWCIKEAVVSLGAVVAQLFKEEKTINR